MNIKKIQNLYFGFYEAFKRKTISKYVRNRANRYLINKNILSEKEKKEALEFFAPYAKIDPVFHAYYKEKTGKFNAANLPMDLYINKIDEYFNDRNASHVLDNKCMYSRLFPGIPIIESIASKMGKFWYNGKSEMVSKEEWLSLLDNEPAIFIKAATDSCGGKGVSFIKKGEADKLNMFLNDNPGDIVVQKPFVQHSTFAKLNEASVNTLRMLSLLTDEGVKIYSSVIRMGVGDAKIDNASQGGVFCGIDDDGKLKDTAYSSDGENFKIHPTTGIKFDGYEIGGFDKAKELIIKAHPMVPYFRMISWDIAVGEDGEAYMLEANFAKGGVNSHQLSNGPLFGDDTKKILDEVFGKKLGN